MADNPEKLLIISGAVGVGKTSVALELSILLEREDIPHCYIDLDALTYTFPRNQADPHGNTLALNNLQAVWKNSYAAGARNLVIPRVIESADQAATMAQSVNLSNVSICRLTATDATLINRVRSREIGSVCEWHEKRSLELSKSLQSLKVDDFCLSTDDRSVTDIATELMLKTDWYKQ